MQRKSSKTLRGKRTAGSQQRVVRPRLSDMVKAAHNAGVQVSVSLEPKRKPYWQVAHQYADGGLSSVSLTSQLGVVQMVARLLDAEGVTTINIMAGKLQAP